MLNQHWFEWQGAQSIDLAYPTLDCTYYSPAVTDYESDWLNPWNKNISIWVEHITYLLSSQIGKNKCVKLF